jgi:hypothetical protein
MNHSIRAVAASGFFSLAFGVAACSSSGPNLHDEPVGASQSAASATYDWLQFYGGAQHAGNNVLETQITAQNVKTLGQLFQVALPGKVDSAPVVLTNVATSSGTRDLVFVTASDGHTAALDAHTGVLVWSHLNTGSNFTTSAPAIDPSRAYVYSYGLDGAVHKYAVGTGTETTTGGWPEATTLKPSLEKGSTSLAITTVGSTSYLHIGYSGYGDSGDYQGHLSTINLSTGAQNVFNAVCSNQNQHFVTNGSPDCPYVQSAIWGRSGAVYDAATNKIYAGTGNGTFDPKTFQWGDTVLALNPDGSGNAAGQPLDSYTPSVFQNLQMADLDLGSASPAILPGSGTKYPDIALQSGKDGVLRIINLDNLSGQGAPGNVAGEIFSVSLPSGNTVANGMPVWINPADQSTWVFVSSYSAELFGYKLAVDANGNPSISMQWEQATTGTGGSLLVADNLLYSAINNSIRALDPTTGNVLWSASNIGTIHWQSPVVANGILYIADNSSQLTAYSLNQTTLVALPRTGWVASASASAGGSPPQNALDGVSSTRWSTGAPQANGQWFDLDMLSLQTFSEITLDAATSTNDYPRGYQVFVSSDGATWGTPIASGNGTSALVPIALSQQVTSRYLRILQTGTATNWWSIAELNVYGPGGQPPPPTEVLINAGGGAVAPYVADEFFSGGATLNHANTIDVSGVTNPAPAAVYQTARVDNFTYTVPGFTAGSSHMVRLHFAETYFSSAGARTFDVSLNGTQVLTGFDIYKTAGAKNKAVAQAFTANANASGQFVIQFTSVINNSLVSGIEIQ